jgi:hypothetical protein
VTTRAEQQRQLAAERAAPVPDHPDQVPPVVLHASADAPAARGVTPLGLPYPEPTDPLADAAAHVKALSDAVSALLAAPGRIWGQYVTTQNQYGGIWVYTGSLPVVQTYNVQSGYRGGTAPTNYVFLFVLGGTWNTTGITCNCFTLAGAATANLITEHSFTGSSS